MLVSVIFLPLQAVQCSRHLHFLFTGIIGSCEDQDEADIRSQFDTNVLGILNILQLTLPYFRERGYGRYIIFSSIAGFSGIPGLGPYGATKFAVEGLVESLMYEIAPFGVKATLVEPSMTRRDEYVLHDKVWGWSGMAMDCNSISDWFF